MTRAVELATDDEGRGAMLVAPGRDRRATGDMPGAQAALVEVVELALARGDAEGAAQAAGVFGGVALWPWRDYPTRDDDVVAMLRTVLAGTAEPRLRAELLGTLACELCYSEDRTEALGHAREAARIARALGDVPLLGRALNNLYLAGWRPAHAEELHAALNESLAHAGRGLPVHSEAVARLHRSSIALRNGELDLSRADLVRAQRLAVEVGLVELRAQVSLQECGHATLGADWERAEQHADRAFALQRRTKLWGARWCRAVQYVTIRRGQDRLGEIVDAVVDASRSAFVGLRPLAVLALAETGDRPGARSLLERTAVHVPQDWTTDFLRCVWGEIAAVLGPPDPRQVYAELLPQAGQLVVAGTANACWGSVHGVLGRLALRIGEHDTARAHLAEAVRVDGRLGALPWQARARTALDELTAPA